MAKTVASIEAQIAALMAEKKELEIAERKADKDALGVAESIIGKIVFAYRRCRLEAYRSRTA